MDAALTTGEIFSGIKLVDVDTHVSEWPDLWTSRAPASLRDRMPQIVDVNGKPGWVIDGKPLGMIGTAISAIKNDGSKALGMGFRRWVHADVHHGAYDAKARVAYMDQEGFQAQIAYGNILGFGGQNAARLDAELRLASTQIFNDAMAELQAESGNRVFPMALLPWWDVKLAVAEAERCAKMGMRGVNTNSDPHTVGLPPLGDPHWDPLWEACSSLGLPVNFHVGASDESMTWFSGGAWPSHSLDTRFGFGSVMLFISNARVIANILFSGFLERFPKLNIVSVESGVGWVPFVLEAVAYQMAECGVKTSLTPLEIFQRQIYACTWFERRDLVNNVRSLGVDNVMFETDFPHPTCLYPDPLQYMRDTAAQFSLEERRKVFGGTAARLYNLPNC